MNLKIWLSLGSAERNYCVLKAPFQSISDSPVFMTIMNELISKIFKYKYIYILRKQKKKTNFNYIIIILYVLSSLYFYKYLEVFIDFLILF